MSVANNTIRIAAIQMCAEFGEVDANLDNLLRHYMKTYENVIRLYAQALKDNDYQAIIDLFSKNARVFSFQAGEKSPVNFFQDLFKNSSRSNIEIKNIFFDSKNRKTVAAYIYLEALLNNKHPIQFEAVDIFEFDQENKIKNLKIILDTYPFRALKEKF